MRPAFAVMLAAAALAGCTLEPHYVRPQPAVPGAWPTGPAYLPPTAAALPSVSWRDLFHDPHLQNVINQALANNQDLRAAMAQVEVARAEYRVQRAELFPHVDAGVTAEESHGPLTIGGPTGAQTRVSSTSRNYDSNIGVSSFELDLFGRLRSLSHAAQEQYFASEAGASAARLTLVGETAGAWLTLGADRSLLAIARDTVTSASKTVDLTRSRVTGGVAPRSDLDQALTVLQTAQSDLASLTTQVAQDRNALELLVGAPVADADLPASIEAVDGSLGEAPAGLDSRILLRRPDVAQAEYNLRSANAEIGAARAAFFPTISLTALAGTTSPALSALFAGSNFTWRGAASITQPLFAGGANAGNLARAHGERDVAVATYQKAIQSAFRDVADALARRGTIKDQLSAETNLEAAARDNLTLEEARYRGGVTPFLNTLDAQRTYYSAQRTLAATRLIEALNLVTLYRSLGGDELIDAMRPPVIRTATR